MARATTMKSGNFQPSLYRSWAFVFLVAKNLFTLSTLNKNVKLCLSRGWKSKIQKYGFKKERADLKIFADTFSCSVSLALLLIELNFLLKFQVVWSLIRQSTFQKRLICLYAVTIQLALSSIYLHFFFQLQIGSK